MSFHCSLPSYAQTPLINVSTLARNLAVTPRKLHLFVKLESERLTLPSFKILGASWAIHNLLTERLSLPLSASIAEVSALARNSNFHLLAASEGNWGRKVAYAASSLYSTRSTVFVPDLVPETTQNLIRSSGADCTSIPGHYDEAVRVVTEKAGEDPDHLLLCLDTSWPGYEQFPFNVTKGYMTMLLETSKQLSNVCMGPATHVVISVGVGSWAHAVVAYYKSLPSPATVIAVEPLSANCLQCSMRAGRIKPINAQDTIMCGMCCGTVSYIAWPILQKGVDYSVTVTDEEAHDALLKLNDQGVYTGPCGAATLAGFFKTVQEKPSLLDEDAIVVLFSTEGPREYSLP